MGIKVPIRMLVFNAMKTLFIRIDPLTLFFLILRFVWVFHKNHFVLAFRESNNLKFKGHRQTLDSKFTL